MDRIIREEARLVILRELAEQPNYSLNESLLTATLGLGYLLMHRMGRDSLVRARALSRARSQLVALNDDLDNQVKVRTQLLEHGRQVVTRVGPHRRESVDHVVPGIAGGAQHLARAGDDLDASPQSLEPRDHRSRGLDRHLE